MELFLTNKFSRFYIYVTSQKHFEYFCTHFSKSPLPLEFSESATNPIYLFSINSIHHKLYLSVICTPIILQGVH